MEIDSVLYLFDSLLLQKEKHQRRAFGTILSFFSRIPANITGSSSIIKRN